MKKIVVAAMVSLAVLFAVSCQSTGSAGGSDNTPQASSTDDAALERIYDRYEGGIILTGAKTYKVVSGDNLSKIARANYGAGDNGYYFPLIIAATKEPIADPDKIEIGTELTIPDLNANLNNPQARGNLKNLLKDVADFYARKGGTQSEQLNQGLTRLNNTL
ncbi:MAG: LysM peptidoglycan-binding domain-containing protein [Treponema sp.]|jgi:LysM repeat protein|nr:LysM peptidoglycan-binding domain-containing protein [Treponema sp.]